METSKNRLYEIDVLRGCIMILMAIDHASFFIRKVHFSEVWGLGLPNYLNMGEFFTRYITHVAPTGFFILMGVGISLSKDRKNYSYYFRRSLFILALHLLLEHRLWSFVSYNTNPSVFRFGEFPGSSGIVEYDLGVLFALSMSLAIWGLLRHAKQNVILSISTASIFLPTLLISIISTRSTPTLLQMILYIPWRGHGFFLLYPLLPWLGLTGCGLLLGGYIKDSMKSTKDTKYPLTVKFLAMSIALYILFIISKFTGIGSIYPIDLDAQNKFVQFISVVKYPASISYILITTGSLLLLFSIVFATSTILRPLYKHIAIIGREPLFFYFLHLWIYASISPYFPNGASLGQMYLVWGVSLPVFYVFCFLWGNFNQK